MSFRLILNSLLLLFKCICQTALLLSKRSFLSPSSPKALLNHASNAWFSGIQKTAELGYTRLPRFLLTGAHDHSGFRSASVSTMPSTEQIAAVIKENVLPTAVKNGQSTDTMPQPVITMP